MELALDELIQSQIDLHGRISRSVDNLKKLGQANITAGAVEARMNILENHWAKFEEQHRILFTVHKDTVKNLDYKKKDYVSIVEETYLVQKGVLLDYSALLARQNQLAEAPTSPRAIPTPSRSTLPRIQLPQFSGKYEDWPAFRDLFQSIIGKDGNLSDVEKLHYLKGSELTMITERLAQRLRLPRQGTSVAVFGVGGQQTSIAKGRSVVKVFSRAGETAVTTSALILPRLTGYASVSDAPLSEWTHIEGLTLADPDLVSADAIDVLLGADVYARILCNGLRKGTGLQPVAQKTI
ncbi:hypothetical protein RF55_17840, partial [Lasius niger]